MKRKRPMTKVAFGTGTLVRRAAIDVDSTTEPQRQSVSTLPQAILATLSATMPGMAEKEKKQPWVTWPVIAWGFLGGLSAAVFENQGWMHGVGLFLAGFAVFVSIASLAGRIGGD
jgi:hypothetical protein